jgi:YegS/Rv2252/BmrU family lipid kinase
MEPTARKKLLFVINPRSGVLKKHDVPELIKTNINSSQFSYTIQYTEFAGHAKSIAATAILEGYSAVIAVGGDGSINEIASQLVGTEVALGILPMGSGNGLARHLNIPLAITKAIQLLNNYQIQAIDVARVNENYFFGLCGIGFDGFIANQFQLEKKRGIFTYLKLSAYHYFHYKSTDYQLTVDGKTTTEKAFIIAIANSNQFGSDFKIAPMADLKDALLHCCVVKPFSFPTGMLLVLKGFLGKIRDGKSVQITNCKNVTIESKGTQYYHLDGEPYLVDGAIHIQIVPLALKVIC